MTAGREIKDALLDQVVIVTVVQLRQLGVCAFVDGVTQDVEVEQIRLRLRALAMIVLLDEMRMNIRAGSVPVPGMKMDATHTWPASLSSSTLALLRR